MRASKRKKLYAERKRAIELLAGGGMTVSQISRITSVSRPTIYAVIRGKKVEKMVSDLALQMDHTG